MEKFLFTDGTNGVKEVHSRNELQELAERASQPAAIRIWVFSHHEWMSYAAFSKQFPFLKKPKTTIPVKDRDIIPGGLVVVPVKRRSRPGRKLLLYACIGAGIFLVFNFTRMKWEKGEAVTITAPRPANVPYMDVDSLITDIENSRGQRIDKNTKHNLRLRNTWPDAILLQATAERDQSSNGNKYYNINISIDNTTGYKLEKAGVLLTVWKGDEIAATDTVQFNNIIYSGKETRQLEGKYRGDSISVAFEFLEARAFNFCYSAAKENNSGNYNDRWFCRGN